VPKATVDEDCNPCSGKGDVDALPVLTGDLAVQLIPITARMEYPSECKFRNRVPPTLA
jgi:hypothetical protein